jgi:hypothetical protein
MVTLSVCNFASYLHVSVLSFSWVGEDFGNKQRGMLKDLQRFGKTVVAIFKINDFGGSW